MKDCVCGKPIDNSKTTNTHFWEEKYCSKYCRLFNENNMEKENRGEKLRLEGNPNWKNFTGFFDYPVIKTECVCCGNEVLLKKTKDANKPYCSKACLAKINKHPKSRKSIFVFTMLRILKHRSKYYEGGEMWLTSQKVNHFMQRHGYHPEKGAAKYVMLLRIWASRGALEVREAKHLTERGVMNTIKEYRFNPAHMNKPLGKVFYECAGVPFD